jgi:hypothetical protein
MLNLYAFFTMGQEFLNYSIYEFNNSSPCLNGASFLGSSPRHIGAGFLPYS